MENNEELPEIHKKLINGVEITNEDYAKIAMVCDYLILDRFHDISSFFRLENCFGPFFAKENPNFLPEVFKEICGEKKKYISFGRLILAFIKWKSKSSTNENFNKFMDLVFGNMIKTQNEVIGKLVEGGRIFSTRNTRGRKVISRFSVLTDESKNKIEGFHIQYDDFFDTVLSPKKTRDDITLEMNFAPNGNNIRDRDGISHIGGKYSITQGIIKFLIFKCRSGKTFYIGDTTEEEGEEFQFFLFGTSSCQLKTVRVELVNEQLIYLEPKFQPSLRVNQKIIDFESLDEKYINENILNAPLIFEENEMKDIPMEQLIETNILIVPCISDDAFIDKKTLIEPLSGKSFNEIYKTYLISQAEVLDQEKEDLKKKIYEKTIMRKHLLKIYFNKFKVKENIFVLKTNKPDEERVNMDKFLCKIKAYRKKVNKKIEKQKEELAAEEEVWDDEEDWVNEKDKEIIENNAEQETKEEEKKDEEKKEEEKKDEEKKDEEKKEEEKKDEEKKDEEKKDEEKKSEEKKEEEKKEEEKKEEEKKEEEKKEEEKKEEEKKDEEKKEEEKKEEEKKEVEKKEVEKKEEVLQEEENKINSENEVPKNDENEKKEKEKIEIEPPKIEIEPPKIENDQNKEGKEEKKVEVNIEGPKVDDLKVEAPGEEKILIEVTNEKNKPEEDEKIILKTNKPKKLLKKSLNKMQNNQEEQKKEENLEEPKKEVKLEENKKEENLEEPKKEVILEENKKEEILKEPKKEIILEEDKKEESKKEEPKKEETKKEIEKKEDNKIINENNNKIIMEKEENKTNNNQNKNINNNNIKTENDKKVQQPPKKKKWFCITF